VQGQYKRRLLQYYAHKEADNLRGKNAWITDDFIAGKVDAT